MKSHPDTGKYLRSLREEAGYSQRHVANYLDVAQSRIWQIEHDGADLQMSTVLGYCEAIGAHVTIRLKPETPPAQT